MFAAYVLCTCVAAFACGYAVYLNLARAPFVAETSKRLGVSASLMVPCGALLAAAAAGLLAGFAVPGLGTAAACGLVAYFVIALSAHLRARDFQIAWPLAYLSLGTAALATALAYHGPLG
jgi:DoxX-like family